MKTPMQIVQESGFGSGFDDKSNQFKRELAMGAEIILDQERKAAGGATGDRSLATVMALNALVHSQAQIQTAIKSGMNPFVLLKEKRDVFAGEVLTCMAHFSANYGAGETATTFQSWKVSGCPSGSDYVAWLGGPRANLQRSAMSAVPEAPITEAPSAPTFGRPGPLSMTTTHGIPTAPTTTVKLTAAQESIAKQMGRDPAEVAAWRATNVPGQ
jgi:hypothetical protein